MVTNQHVNRRGGWWSRACNFECNCHVSWTRDIRGWKKLAELDSPPYFYPVGGGILANVSDSHFSHAMYFRPIWMIDIVLSTNSGMVLWCVPTGLSKRKKKETRKVWNCLWVRFFFCQLQLHTLDTLPLMRVSFSSWWVDCCKWNCLFTGLHTTLIYTKLKRISIVG